MSIPKLLLPKSPEPWFAAWGLPHFSAQAVLTQDPSLRHRAFAIIEQKAQSHKTPILSLSKAALAQGLEAGMPAFLALRRQPSLLLFSRDLGIEANLRETLSTLLLSFTPVFFLQSNGSALLDMTGTPSTRQATPDLWAQRLLSQAMALGLETIYLGIAASQVVAKVLVRLVTPNGFQICPPGMEHALLSPLSPQLLPGLSPHARNLLRKYGLNQIERIRKLERKELDLRFGQEAEKLYCLVRGLDLESIVPRPLSLHAETVLIEDLNDEEKLRGQIRLTADQLGYTLREQNRLAASITLLLNYSDGHKVRKSLKLQPPTSAFLKLATAAEKLWYEIHQRRVALRRIRLDVTMPTLDTGQTDLFDSLFVHKQEALAQALDKIRRKRGFTDVRNALG